MTATHHEIEEVSPQMIYWILAIVILVALVYFTLGFMGIQIAGPNPTDLPADASEFTFICPLGAFH